MSVKGGPKPNQPLFYRPQTASTALSNANTSSSHFRVKKSPSQGSYWASTARSRYKLSKTSKTTNNSKLKPSLILQPGPEENRAERESLERARQRLQSARHKKGRLLEGLLRDIGDRDRNGGDGFLTQSSRPNSVSAKYLRKHPHRTFQSTTSQDGYENDDCTQNQSKEKLKTFFAEVPISKFRVATQESSASSSLRGGVKRIKLIKKEEPVKAYFKGKSKIQPSIAAVEGLDIEPEVAFHISKLFAKKKKKAIELAILNDYDKLLQKYESGDGTAVSDFNKGRNRLDAYQKEYLAKIFSVIFGKAGLNKMKLVKPYVYPPHQRENPQIKRLLKNIPDNESLGSMNCTDIWSGVMKSVSLKQSGMIKVKKHLDQVANADENVLAYLHEHLDQYIQSSPFHGRSPVLSRENSTST